MKLSMYCYDIEDLVEKLKNEEDPTEWIFIATEVIKVCRSVIDIAIETASNTEVSKKQAELNI